MSNGSFLFGFWSDKFDCEHVLSVLIFRPISISNYREQKNTKINSNLKYRFIINSLHSIEYLLVKQY